MANFIRLRASAGSSKELDFIEFPRREGDLNPRGSVNPQRHFQCRALGQTMRSLRKLFTCHPRLGIHKTPNGSSAQWPRTTGRDYAIPPKTIHLSPDGWGFTKPPTAAPPNGRAPQAETMRSLRKLFTCHPIRTRRRPRKPRNSSPRVWRSQTRKQCKALPRSLRKLFTCHPRAGIRTDPQGLAHDLRANPVRGCSNDSGFARADGTRIMLLRD